MSLEEEPKVISTISQRKQLKRCCICGDDQILVNYMGFWVCLFCAAGEKVESEE